MTNLKRVRIDNYGLITQSDRGQLSRIFLARPQINAVKKDPAGELIKLAEGDPKLRPFFDAEGRLVATVDIADEDIGCLSRPLRVYYNIEPRCNLTCSYCAPRDLHSLLRPASAETEEFLLQQISDAGAFQLQLTGGEIFIRGRKIFPVLQRTEELGFATTIGTNGVWRHIQDQKGFAQQLAGFKTILKIKVSIEGTPEFHDSLRGIGTYAEAKRTLRLLSEAGMRTVVNATIFRDSCTTEQIEHLAQLAQETGSGLRLRPLRETGRAQTLLHKSTPTVKDLMAYTVRARELREQLGIKITVNFDILGGGRKLVVFDPERPFSCRAGVWGFGVTHTGETNICGYAIEVNPPGIFMPGKVTPERSLLDIWKNSPVLWQWRRAGKSAQCRSCSDYLATACWGGCMVQAYITHGSLSALDPHCFKALRDAV